MLKKQEKIPQNLDLLVKEIVKISKKRPLKPNDFFKLQHKFPDEKGSLFSKTQVIKAIRSLDLDTDVKNKLIKSLQLRPIRSSSGVTPVTILTKPYPCPGQCIFCPADVRMPKSYIYEEPGAQRAEKNFFDPYLQTISRLEALYNMGHPLDKIEIIILGGTWDYYPLLYRIFFIKEVFRALNEFFSDKKSESLKQKKLKYDFFVNQAKKLELKFLTNNASENEKLFEKDQKDINQGKKNYNAYVSSVLLKTEKLLGIDKYQTATWEELKNQQDINEKSKCRMVGLVIETRPDLITEKSVKEYRKFGVTKVQVGIQSLNNKVLELNKRGHTSEDSAKAFSYLRAAGFKIHAHWMANLYGSDVQKDKKDYDKLFSDKRFRPDELKIYPCSVLENAELFSFYKKGLWKPYSYEQLLEVVEYVLSHTPIYCRLTRVVRDIPSQFIVDGNKKTNFRQIATNNLIKKGKYPTDIRAREVRRQKFDEKTVSLNIKKYETSVSEEYFLYFDAKLIDSQRRVLLGFLRLSLPFSNEFTKKVYEQLPELEYSSLIREVHVYGPSKEIGKTDNTDAQHIGLGKKLIKKAIEISRKKSYKKISVISSIGTHEYYRKVGFKDGSFYQYYLLD